MLKCWQPSNSHAPLSPICDLVRWTNFGWFLGSWIFCKQWNLFQIMIEAKTSAYFQGTCDHILVPDNTGDNVAGVQYAPTLLNNPLPNFDYCITSTCSPLCKLQSIVILWFDSPPSYPSPKVLTFCLIHRQINRSLALVSLKARQYTQGRQCPYIGTKNTKCPKNFNKIFKCIYINFNLIFYIFFHKQLLLPNWVKIIYFLSLFSAISDLWFMCVVTQRIIRQWILSVCVPGERKEIYCKKHLGNYSNLFFLVG